MEEVSKEQLYALALQLQAGLERVENSLDRIEVILSRISNIN